MLDHPGHFGIDQRSIHCIICTYTCANTLRNPSELRASQQEQHLRTHGESSEKKTASITFLMLFFYPPVSSQGAMYVTPAVTNGLMIKPATDVSL
jgi:hypothetical protein